ncbi:uncharacterized protein FIBRA_08494 [Fibroporia radiculosa]|uniref:Protein kinase domain-containing protein n=1 Tax=Fibroporia radiculosa TaxID=599839 RepID=J4GWW7_9APHY|nr:uncharacterized protein FIBRA_08494 [Fibroporia radiculosa]CCM06245.1 predicted protein [Fibroporia radiculosa]
MSHTHKIWIVRVDVDSAPPTVFQSEKVVFENIQDVDAVDFRRAVGAMQMLQVSAKTISLWKLNDCLPIKGVRQVLRTSLEANNYNLASIAMEGLLDTTKCPFIYSIIPTEANTGARAKRRRIEDEHDNKLRNNVREYREDFLDDRKEVAPSSAGKVHEFRRLQDRDERSFYCNRPPPATDPIPLSLLHPVFAQFADDCRYYETTDKDHLLAQALSAAMSEFYNDKEARMGRVQDIFHKVDILLTGAEIAGTEPQAQELAPNPLPCILILIYGALPLRPPSPSTILPTPPTGPHMHLAGAAWNRRPATEPLSCGLNMHDHNKNYEMRELLARHLGALKSAVRALESYCSSHRPIIASTASRLLDAPERVFPYPTSFQPFDDGPIAGGGLSGEAAFTYSHQHNGGEDGKLVFFAECASRRVCITFTKRYCMEAHRECARMGFAPRLWGFNDLPDNWKMVVMDAVDGDSYKLVFDLWPRPADLGATIREKLKEFHGRGFVHRDIRDANPMARTSPVAGESAFMLLDFDWAGRAGEARYPKNLYKGRSLWRPSRVGGGGLILADDDLEMLDCFFRQGLHAVGS